MSSQNVVVLLDVSMACCGNFIISACICDVSALSRICFEVLSEEAQVAPAKTILDRVSSSQQSLDCTVAYAMKVLHEAQSASFQQFHSISYQNNRAVATQPACHKTKYEHPSMHVSYVLKL